LDGVGSPKDVQGLKCVVMGSKREQPRAGVRSDGTPFQFPLLLVAPKVYPVGRTGPPVYERVGVGKLEDHEMVKTAIPWVQIS